MKELKGKYFGLLFLFVLCGQLYSQDIFEAARKGNIARMEALIAIKPDTINSRNENGFTPLIIAGYRNQIKAVEFLLDHKVDINATSPEGPVILGACFHGNFELTDLLIKRSANVNVQNDLGTTPLIFAVISKNKALVELLLKNKADKDLKEASGRNALFYAQMYEEKDMIALLSD